MDFPRHQTIEFKVFYLNDLMLNVDEMLRRLTGEDIELVILSATGLDVIKFDPGKWNRFWSNRYGLQRFHVEKWKTYRRDR